MRGGGEWTHLIRLELGIIQLLLGRKESLFQPVSLLLILINSYSHYHYHDDIIMPWRVGGKGIQATRIVRDSQLKSELSDDLVN